MNVAAIGALAGLRTGEVFGLHWDNVDLQGRRFHVCENWGGAPTKDKQSRVVPVMGGLLPVLQAWKAKSGGEGLVIPSLRVDGGHIDNKPPATTCAPHSRRPGSRVRDSAGTRPRATRSRRSGVSQGAASRS